MPVKGKTLNSSTYKDISEVYLNDGRTVNAIYAPVNGHYELVYVKANEHTITGVLPLTFTDDHANGTILDAFTLYNESENVVGDKTANLAPSLDKWSPDVTINSTSGGTGEETYAPDGLVMSSPFIEVEASTRYVLKGARVESSSGIWTNIIWFNEDKIVISASAGNNDRAITTPANAAYVRIVLGYAKYFGFFKQPSGTPTYVPYGYACPITVNETTKTIYLPSSITNKVKYVSSKMLSGITLNDGPVSYSGTSGSPTYFNVDASNRSNFYYVANGKVYSSSDTNHNVDKYILGSYGDTSDRLAQGTYTISVAVKNPPVVGDWFVSFYVGYSDSYPWRGCTVTRSNIVNGVAKASLTITVDSTAASKVGYALIRFGGDYSDVYFANTVVNVSIVAGSKPSYPTHELIDSENNVVQISEMPIFSTNNGSNTFDVGTTNKPTKASVSW